MGKQRSLFTLYPYYFVYRLVKFLLFVLLLIVQSTMINTKTRNLPEWNSVFYWKTNPWQTQSQWRVTLWLCYPSLHSLRHLFSAFNWRSLIWSCVFGLTVEGRLLSSSVLTNSFGASACVSLCPSKPQSVFMVMRKHDICATVAHINVFLIVFGQKRIPPIVHTLIKNTYFPSLIWFEPCSGISFSP